MEERLQENDCDNPDYAEQELRDNNSRQGNAFAAGIKDA